MAARCVCCIDWVVASGVFDPHRNRILYRRPACTPACLPIIGGEGRDFHGQHQAGDCHHEESAPPQRPAPVRSYGRPEGSWMLHRNTLRRKSMFSKRKRRWDRNGRVTCNTYVDVFVFEFRFGCCCWFGRGGLLPRAACNALRRVVQGSTWHSFLGREESTASVNPMGNSRSLLGVSEGEQAVPGAGVLQEGRPDEHPQRRHEDGNLRPHERHRRVVHHAPGEASEAELDP